MNKYNFLEHLSQCQPKFNISALSNFKMKNIFTILLALTIAATATPAQSEVRTGPPDKRSCEMISGTNLECCWDAKGLEAKAERKVCASTIKGADEMPNNQRASFLYEALVLRNYMRAASIEDALFCSHRGE